MIAKVRIAPFEKWCEPMKQAGSRCSRRLAEGVEISIETSSMRTTQETHLCGGREWLVTQVPPYVSIVDEDGDHPTGNGAAWVCEHMLELD